MSDLENNYERFTDQYDFTKRNYNIIIHSPSASGKYEFINHILEKYYNSHNIRYSQDIQINPDILYLSLPLFNKSGKFERNITNNERLLYEFGFEEKFDNCRVGTEISVDQIRGVKEFTNISPRYKHKFVIINNCNYLNQQSSAALLKTLEETNSSCIFLLLASEIDLLKDTIKSRCHSFSYTYNMKIKTSISYFDFYVSSKPGLKKIHEDNGYLENYNLFENELSELYKKDINPISLSKNWMDRGHLCIDYLLSLFYILMRGFGVKDPVIQKIHTSLKDKIPINSARAIAIINILYEYKIDSRRNLNKKLFYDNLLIVLNKELY